MFELWGALASRARVGTRITKIQRLCTALSLFLLCVPVSWAARDTGAASFSIDLDKPYADVLAIVSDVAHAATIKGTFEYRGEDSLDKAEFQENSRVFPAWTEPGKVFYKVRTKALSPSHFLNSNDVGTVAVRYVVQERGPNSTRLFIDAVFVENARHHGHPSDGYVETCEFGEIGKRLKERDQLLAETATGQQFSPGTESSSRKEDALAQPVAHPSPPVPAAEVVDTSKTSDLANAIAEQKSQLAADYAGLEKLEGQARQLRSAEFVKVKADRAELKALPYTHARVVESLKRGQEVTVLSKSAFWYQVRSEDGQEGWISHSMLEAQP
jgi:Bacterial SH3 domain